MAMCCPPGHGCNAPGADEPCALVLCRVAAQQERDAALALDRWGALEEASEQKCDAGERRFRRRAFERARDQALITLAMKPRLWTARRAVVTSATPKAAPRRRSRRHGSLAYR
jgi:hypothetical protein